MRLPWDDFFRHLKLGRIPAAAPSSIEIRSLQKLLTTDNLYNSKTAPSLSDSSTIPRLVKQEIIHVSEQLEALWFGKCPLLVQPVEFNSQWLQRPYPRKLLMTDGCLCAQTHWMHVSVDWALLSSWWRQTFLTHNDRRGIMASVMSKESCSQCKTKCGSVTKMFLLCMDACVKSSAFTLEWNNKKKKFNK